MLYQFVSGPLAWVTFIVFFSGIIYRIVKYIKGLDWQKDRVAYREYFYPHGIKGALRSIFFWLIPFGTHSWREKPGMTILFFTFHFGLLFTPVFLLAHNTILKERWGFSLWTISDTTADMLTIMVMICAVALILRRISLPEVRILTNLNDLLMIAIAISPFVTGFIAFRVASGYQFWLILHILCGEIWLMAIPFTKLSHFILFFMSRAQLGMDYGIKRGGMKGTNMSW